MPPSELQLQRDEWKEKVFTLQSTAPEALQAMLEALTMPKDPVLAGALKGLFSRNNKGKTEGLRMEIDLYRRLSRGSQTERIFRPYGVIELATPIQINGKTCGAICSGPLLVHAWTSAAKQTLAQLCGLSAKEIPVDLESATLYSPAHLQVLTGMQEQLAAWISELFERPLSGDAPQSPSVSESSLEILQPGFTDHLDVLFGLIQKATPQGQALAAEDTARIHKIAERGRKLTDHAKRLRDQAEADPDLHSVHTVVTQWCAKLETRYPHLRIRTRLEAELDQVLAAPQQLHHLVYTLLNAIADGLPEGRALLGVSTRNDSIDGETVVHLEIRDGGGLATFAGVGGELDQQLEAEQTRMADDGAEWTALASRLNATVRILRDTDTVTRAEVFIPLAPEVPEEQSEPGMAHIWIIEDDDHEVKNLKRMLEPLKVSCTRFTSAAELKTNFSTATHAPDMVLLKYYLPDERGADVRSWLYEQDSTLPVLMISSLDATHPGIATVQRLPSTLYLQKPFDAADLQDMIHFNLDDTLAG